MITSKSFGFTKDNKEATLYELSNSKGMKVCVSNFGAVLVSIYVPDKDGKFDDVCLGYDDVSGYEENPSFFGAVIGPSANRIGNASFTIDGCNYTIDKNDGPNNLHSDIPHGVHKRLWNASVGDNSVTFSIESADLDMGFPGNKVMSVTYSLTENNELKLFYAGSSDKNTIINLTNHAYFNLSGQACGKEIVDHVLTMKASNYTPTIKGSIPTGEIAPVAGTVMDFTSPRRIGDDIDAKFEQLLMAGGYDHNFVIDDYDGTLRYIAKVEDNNSGRVMEVYTTLPGVQFYAGNFIGDRIGKGGTDYHKRYGMCLETQYFPDTIHHDNFPSCVFGPDKDYTSETVYKFS